MEIITFGRRHPLPELLISRYSNSPKVRRLEKNGISPRPTIYMTNTGSDARVLPTINGGGANDDDGANDASDTHRVGQLDYWHKPTIQKRKSTSRSAKALSFPVSP